LSFIIKKYVNSQVLSGIKNIKGLQDLTLMAYFVGFTMLDHRSFLPKDGNIL